jgi:hypothetical protein
MMSVLNFDSFSVEGEAQIEERGHMNVSLNYNNFCRIGFL